MNICTFIGNLTSDPELSTVGQYDTVLCKFTLAVNTKTKKGDEVLFIKCSLFGKGGEVVVKYLSKGSPLAVSGRLQMNEYQGKNYYSILVNEFKFIGNKNIPKKQEPEDEVPF